MGLPAASKLDSSFFRLGLSSFQACEPYASHRLDLKVLCYFVDIRTLR